MLAPQIIDLDRFGSVIINDNAKTFHLELYEEKIKGTIFRKRVRGKCLLNKTYYFNQLLNFKVIDQHDQCRASKDAEKLWGIRNCHQFFLGVELFLDDNTQNYFRVSFGTFFSAYMAMRLDKTYKQAQQILGKFTSVLEHVRHQSRLHEITQNPPIDEPIQCNTPAHYHVILEGTNPKTTQYFELLRLIKEKNPKMGFLKRQIVIQSSGQTIFTTAIPEEAEGYAAQIAATGASVSVRKELLHFDSTSCGIHSNSASSINVSNLSKTVRQAISQAIPTSASAGNTPQKKSPCGCFAVIFLIFMLGVLAHIGNNLDKEGENQEQTSTEQTPKKQDEPKISAAIENKPVVIQEEAKKIETPIQPPRVEPVPAKQPESASKTEAKETKTSTSTTQPKPIIKAVIAPNALHILPTKKGQGYDKTIARYGVARIKKINKLLPIIAEKAATLECMDYIFMVDVSDTKSTPDLLVFYVDSENGMRVYITEHLDVVEIRRVRPK